MRKAFFNTLAELAAEDPRIFLLTADIGYMAIESYSERFPEALPGLWGDFSLNG